MGAIAGGIGGGMLGGKANHGFLGTLAGAFAGHKAEEALKDRRKSNNQQQGYGGGKW